MAFISHRAARFGAAVLLSSALALGTASCGFNAQTLQPYTPAEGVNLDVGEAANNLVGVKVRNLMVLTRADGEGFLSASLIAAEDDELVSASGVALSVDGAEVGPLNVTVAEPVTLDKGGIAVLTDGSPLVVTGPLQAGLEARITLQFATAGSVTAVVPVVDANQHEYQTVTPSASPSASPSE